MAEPADSFYVYRTTFRGLFAAYVASESTAFTKIGTRSKDAHIRLLYITWDKACMLTLESFDPLTTVHMFNAREMKDFEDHLNYIHDTHYTINWALYYTEQDLEAIGIWYDSESGGVWMDSETGGVWYDND